MAKIYYYGGISFIFRTNDHLPKENYLKVIKANVIRGHLVSIVFNDGKESVIDFKPWLDAHHHECWNYLLDETEFKKNMYIDHGDLVWGKDWDLYFSIMNYYNSDLDGDYD